MQRHWIGRKVGLDQLSRWTTDFFKEKGFATRKYESNGEYTILWGRPNAGDTDYSTKVRILGHPEDFVIELVASETTRRTIWLGMITKLFGGGYIMLKSLRLKETLEAIEKDYWAFIEDKIARVTGSI